MAIRTGYAKTTKASRYLQRLCKHWSHKFPVKFDAQKGEIIFADKEDKQAQVGANNASLAALDDRIEVILTCADDSAFDRMQRVVCEHINRFAFREAPLPFIWDRDNENSEGALL